VQSVIGMFHLPVSVYCMSLPGMFDRAMQPAYGQGQQPEALCCHCQTGLLSAPAATSGWDGASNILVQSDRMMFTFHLVVGWPGSHLAGYCGGLPKLVCLTIAFTVQGGSGAERSDR
jgi:hypothetical protein